jgi:cyclase
LDIRATRENHRPDFALVEQLAHDCFVPFSVGGGVRSIEDVRSLLRAGADKVIVNTAALEDPALVPAIAAQFGSQCVVVSIDVRARPGGGYEMFTRSGTVATGKDPVAFARAMAAAGAGEILLTSIERDGTMQGYDVDLIRRVSDAVDVPVIASGGAGNYEHMAAALGEGKASAVAAASMYQFTEQTPLQAKRYLAERGFPMRL